MKEGRPRKGIRTFSFTEDEINVLQVAMAQYNTQLAKTAEYEKNDILVLTDTQQEAIMRYFAVAKQLGDDIFEKLGDRT